MYVHYMYMHTCFHMYVHIHKAMENIAGFLNKGSKQQIEVGPQKGLEFHTEEIILPFIYLVNIRVKMGQISISLRNNHVKLKSQQEFYK